jgi:hypothetical protein
VVSELGSAREIGYLILVRGGCSTRVLEVKLGYITSVRFVDVGETPTTWRNSSVKEMSRKGRCRKSRTGKIEKKNRGIGKS